MASDLSNRMVAVLTSGRIDPQSERFKRDNSQTAKRTSETFQLSGRFFGFHDDGLS